MYMYVLHLTEQVRLHIIGYNEQEQVAVDFDILPYMYSWFHQYGTIQSAIVRVRNPQKDISKSMTSTSHTCVYM